MPVKMQKLKAELRKAGFYSRSAKGSHTRWHYQHDPSIFVTLSGSDSDDMDTQIVSTPGVLGGKPRIDGTRISVELILKQLALGDSIEGLIDNYDITREQILAVLAFAYDQLHEKHLQEVR